MTATPASQRVSTAKVRPPVALTEDEILARVLYRDSMMLVIDKPAGLPVHAGTGGGATLEQSFKHLCYGLPRLPSLAHRLDRDTAGCLILGRHSKALVKLGKLFKQGRIDKTYWAVVEGCPEAESGTIDLPLGKQDPERGWHMKVDIESGLSSVTDWRRLGTSADRALSWLELSPRTGRTHQLRVHCMAMGWPMLGDRIYGSGRESGHPLHLLARAVTIPLYPSRQAVEVTAPPPPHMHTALAACGRVTED